MLRDISWLGPIGFNIEENYCRAARPAGFTPVMAFSKSCWLWACRPAIDRRLIGVPSYDGIINVA